MLNLLYLFRVANRRFKIRAQPDGDSEFSLEPCRADRSHHPCQCQPWPRPCCNSGWDTSIITSTPNAESFSLRPDFPSGLPPSGLPPSTAPHRGTIRVTSATDPASKRQRATGLRAAGVWPHPANPEFRCGPAATGPQANNPDGLRKMPAISLTLDPRISEISVDR